jgi:hypothetical protein
MGFEGRINEKCLLAYRSNLSQRRDATTAFAVAEHEVGS